MLLDGCFRADFSVFPAERCKKGKNKIRPKLGRRRWPVGPCLSPNNRGFRALRALQTVFHAAMARNGGDLDEGLSVCDNGFRLMMMMVMMVMMVSISNTGINWKILPGCSVTMFMTPSIGNRRQV